MLNFWRKWKHNEEGLPKKITPPTSVSHTSEVRFNPLGRFTEVVAARAIPRRESYENISQQEIRQLLAQIGVIAFVGPSGTGKSTRALKVAREHNIGYLIDDGLLIHGSSIVAGGSAKRADTKMESVRQALFADATRAENMRRALVENAPPSLMILGTSTGMLQKICRNLWLNSSSMLIRIEDVTTEEERQQARAMRIGEGKHTIPVPSMEIKHEFSGTFAEPLSKLWRKRQGQAVSPPDSERTVVRPTFSTLGAYAMSDEAMIMLLTIILLKHRAISHIVQAYIWKESYGIVIDIDVALVYGFQAQEILSECQKLIATEVERMTAINILSINLRATKVVKQKQPKVEHVQ